MVTVRKHLHSEGETSRLLAPRHGEDSLAMFAVLGVDAATEPTVRINPQVYAGAVVTTFGAGRTSGLDDSAGQFARLFQFGDVQTHSPSTS